MADVTYTPKDLAVELGITPKDFRRWLRTQTDDRAGRGGTWSIDEETRILLLDAYRAKGPKGKKTTPVLKVTAQSDDEVESDDDLDDVEMDDIEA